MALVLNLIPPTKRKPYSFSRCRCLPPPLAHCRLSFPAQMKQPRTGILCCSSSSAAAGFSFVYEFNLTIVRFQDQARKALEGALGGKKDEFEKWDKEIKRREDVGGGGSAGGGGWFGWGRWFGWSNDGNFWQEAQQASLAVIGIIMMYLMIAKGELMLAVIFNPLLYALRGTRNGFALITSRILRKTPPDGHNISMKEAYGSVSAKESVLRKWGSD